MKLSILTATYNRGELLLNLYKSIISNLIDNLDIEWLIMDDGSNDDTKNVVEKFENIKNLEIKYYYQENQGKMVAINNLAELATGDYIIDCDSDDYFAENAFNIIVKNIDKLAENQDVYALLFLKNDVSGKISGNNFKEDNYKTTMFDLYFKEDIQGEKIILFNAKIRKQYKHILEPGERFVTEARMYHNMDKAYKVICINEILVVGDYLNDGYSKNINKIFIENPKGYLKYFEEILNFDTSKILYKKRMYAIKHYILFSYLIKKKHVIKSIDGRLNKFLIAILYIPGCIKTKLTIKEPKKKLFVSAYTLDIGGIETALVNLVNNLNNNYSVTLALEHKKGVLLDNIDKNITIIEYTPANSKNVLVRKIKNLFKRIKFILKYKNKYNASISFATYSRPGSFMARIASKNNILWIHSNYLVLYKDNMNEMKEFFNSVEYGKFKTIVCISEDAKIAFLQAFPEDKNKTYVINNFINYKNIIEKSKEKIEIDKTNDITFLSICRHDEESKKLTRLIEATKLLKEEGLKFRVLLVGDGKDNLSYREMVKNYDLQDYIFFCGMQKNPYPYFLISDAIILTSEYEGYPVVFIEAKVLNKPIITTNVSDSLIDVKDKCGIVTEKNVQDIKDAMQYFINNGYVIKESFNSEEFNRNIMEKIEKLL